MNLALQGISKAWGGMRVLQDVAKSVSGNGITGLIGPNGAGKTTLFGAICGNVPVDAGSVQFGDLLLDDMSPVQRARTGLSRTFQVPRPFANLSVRANLAVAARGQLGESLWHVYFSPRRVREREEAVMARADAVIDTLNLRRVADHAASQLSGGQLKLLELGRLLMMQPRLILLDEPFAGISPILAETLAWHIGSLNAEGIGFFIVEHNLGALARIATVLFAMDRGRVIAQGTPDEVLANEQVRTAYVGGGA